MANNDAEGRAPGTAKWSAAEVLGTLGVATGAVMLGAAVVNAMFPSVGNAIYNTVMYPTPPVDLLEQARDAIASSDVANTIQLSDIQPSEAVDTLMRSASDLRNTVLEAATRTRVTSNLGTLVERLSEAGYSEEVVGPIRTAVEALERGRAAVNPSFAGFGSAVEWVRNGELTLDPQAINFTRTAALGGTAALAGGWLASKASDKKEELQDAHDEARYSRATPGGHVERLQNAEIRALMQARMMAAGGMQAGPAPAMG